MSSQAKKDNLIAQFRNVTGASQADASKYLKQSNYRVDIAIDSYFDSSNTREPTKTPQSSSQAVNAIFDAYKENNESIYIDGTIRLAQDLDVDLEEDVVMLCLAYELKSPSVGEWPKKPFIDGLKSLRVDSISSFKNILPTLREKLKNDPDYFTKVYTYTFTFGLSEGQRSLPSDSAIAFWNLLLPVGLSGQALAHVNDGSNTGKGWKSEYTQWWLDFITKKKVKGISKDTWSMFIDFVRTVDEKFEKHDADASWPSLIDEFAEHASDKVAGSI